MVDDLRHWSLCCQRIKPCPCLVYNIAVASTATNLPICFHGSSYGHFSSGKQVNKLDNQPTWTYKKRWKVGLVTYLPVHFLKECPRFEYAQSKRHIFQKHGLNNVCSFQNSHLWSELSRNVHMQELSKLLPVWVSNFVNLQAPSFSLSQEACYWDQYLEFRFSIYVYLHASCLG